MRVAIIEDDTAYVTTLKKLLEPFPWNVRFFQSPRDFGKTKLKHYDVIIADESLEPTNGRRLLKTIALKTLADLCLMTDRGFSQEDIEDKGLNGLIDKSNPENIIEHLKYCATKIRINDLSEQEYAVLMEAITQSYRLQMKGRVALVEINQPLTKEDREYLQADLLIRDISGVIISLNTDKIDYPFYRSLNFISGLIDPLHVRIAFWNKNRVKKIDGLPISKITLPPTFEELDAAIDYIEETILIVNSQLI